MSELEPFDTLHDVAVGELDPLRRIEGRHGVPWEDVERRFYYGKTRGVHVLALRVYRLARPQRIENARAYAGCVSWVELDRELPVVTEGPVLNRTEFGKKLEALQAALHG